MFAESWLSSKLSFTKQTTVFAVKVMDPNVGSVAVSAAFSACQLIVGSAVSRASASVLESMGIVIAPALVKTICARNRSIHSDDSAPATV